MSDGEETSPAEPDWKHRGDYIRTRSTQKESAGETNIEPELLTEVSEESEARRHDSLPDDAVGVRRDDKPAPRVLSVRLTADQYDSLAALAAARDLPVSTMARLAILEALDQHARPASGPIDLTTVTAALREVIRPEFLKAG